LRVLFTHQIFVVVHILILNWNNAADTLACLQSLRGQTLREFRVLVLDNGSEAADRQQLKRDFPTDARFRLLTSPDNLGFTRGVNHLLREHILPGDDEFVVLLNNDTEAEPQWLEQLLAQAHRTGADMVASCMINYFARDRMDNAGHFVLNTGEILPLGHDEPVDDHQQARTNAGACAGAALYRVDMLRHIGLFDPFFHTGYEDAELGLRALLCGYDCQYAPQAVVYHKISRSINKIRDFQYTLKIQVDVFYSVLKCWPWPNLVLNLPFFAFKVFGITIMNLVFGRWKFMRVLWTALYRVLIRDRQAILRARRHFFAQAKPTLPGGMPKAKLRFIPQGLPWYAFQQKLTFFLWFDLRRFYKYIWKREKMVFEKY